LGIGNCHDAAGVGRRADHDGVGNGRSMIRIAWVGQDPPQRSRPTDRAACGGSRRRAGPMGDDRDVVASRPRAITPMMSRRGKTPRRSMPGIAGVGFNPPSTRRASIPARSPPRRASIPARSPPRRGSSTPRSPPRIDPRPIPAARRIDPRPHPAPSWTSHRPIPDPAGRAATLAGHQTPPAGHATSVAGHRRMPPVVLLRLPRVLLHLPPVLPRPPRVLRHLPYVL
jgi:hypothetical protein